MGTVLLLLLPITGAGGADPPLQEPPAGGEATPPDLSPTEEDQLAVFVLHRGLYASADLGLFMAFGGTRGHSNAQPYVALKLGFDLDDTFSAQIALSSGYSSGNPLSATDAGFGVPGEEVVDFSLFGVSAEVVAALRPSERFAVEPRLGGGLTVIFPAPHDPSDATAFVGGTAPHGVLGLDLKYLTLLTGFSAGVAFTTYLVFSEKLIPAGSVALVLRYTFDAGEAGAAW